MYVVTRYIIIKKKSIFLIVSNHKTDILYLDIQQKTIMGLLFEKGRLILEAPMHFGKRLVWILLTVVLFSPSFSISKPVERKIVSRVIDGDTILFTTGEKARLIGIDTPERDQRFYDEATNYLKSILKENEIGIEYDQDKKDQYGRSLVYIYLLDGTNVNDMMLENGFAKIYFFPPNLALKDELISHQQIAIDNKIGLWAEEPEGNEPNYVGDPKTLLFHRPSDKAVRKIKNPVIFQTRFEAFRAGFGAHRPCNP